MRLGVAIHLILFVVLGASRAAAQTTCKISDMLPEKRTLAVTCTLAQPREGRNQFSFLDQFAGIDKLSQRISGLKVREIAGKDLPLEIRGDGLFSFTKVAATASGPIEIRYGVRLGRALEPGRYALTSSLGPEAAFLLAGDILPDFLSSQTGLQLEIAAPDGWQVATTEPRNGTQFEIADVNRAVFFLGKLRQRRFEIGAMRLQVAIAGTWDFSDEQVGILCESIARSQASMVGSRESGDFLVTLAPFPQPLTGLRSAALARANTVILMLNAGIDQPRTLKHYQRHLAHEMFHFYLPNAFSIRENFDWFWEGFTRYLGLVTLVQTKALTLNELLANVGDEYDAYLVNPLRSQASLVTASPEKFSDAANYEIVYRKGLVVAALYDLELRSQTRGKQGLPELM
ncbi:MAG: hypothetical protein ABI882_16355, partial [Acidobacteriota bacterium]